MSAVAGPLWDRERVRTTLGPVGPAPLPVRLYASSAPRRLVHRRAARAAIRAAVAARFRADRAYRTTMRSEAARLPGEHGDLDRLARAHGVEELWRDELLWRPWLALPPLEGAAVLRAVTARRATVVHFLHHGPYFLVPHVLAANGVEALTPIGSFNFEQPLPGYRGRKDRRQLERYADGQTLVDAAGARDELRAALERGGAVAITSDLPGSVPATIGRRRMGFAGGSVRLALATGAAVVCLTAHRDRGGDWRLRAHPPLDPADFRTPQALQQAIADVQAPALLETPEAWEWPGGRYRELEA